VQRLGLNIGGYHGEPIDIQRVLHAVEAQVQNRKGWICDRIPVGSETLQSEILACRFTPSHIQKRVYISTGIHGDEPAGPLALLQLIEQNHWPDNVALWLCPCLNPSGFPLNQRENAAGIDLNRDYRHLKSLEIRAHTRWLEQQPRFDLVLCLHEDWESKGFYLYELNPDNQPTLAPAILSRVRNVCPIDESPLIDNWPADKGVIHPPANPEIRPLWAESIYMLHSKTRLTYTMEAPSDFPLQTRVNALVAGVRAAIEFSQTMPAS
jgi:hypothetical protein